MMCVRPYLPYIFAALRHASSCPPLSSPANPSLVLFLRMQGLIAHAELQLVELVATLGHMPESI